MQGFCEPFADKKITVLGLGLLGRGVGDAAFLAECGAHVVVTDTKSEAELAESVAKLAQYKNIEFHLGGHRAEDLTSADMVIKAAGVPLDSPEIAAAKDAGVPVYMSTALFAKYAREAGATIVGVTGTRGKSTTTQMIYHCLIRANKKVVLGGNVRGISTLAMLPEIEKGDICVLELDSWQLQGFGDLALSPHIAVFTNLYPDHLNYYRGDMKAYFADKANIFRYQKKGDTFVAGNGLSERLQAAQPPVEPLFPSALPESWQLRVPGEHNRGNAALAAAALRALGIEEADIEAGLGSFQPLEGRLQLVREVHGVKLYNDNNATTPEATIAALKSLHRDGATISIILIMGGADKGLDMSALVEEIGRRCKAVVLLAGSGTERIREKLPDASLPYHELRSAVDAAMSAAKPGDTVLFSPAFASFGMFKNEYDRNDQFLAIVRAI